jgi:hypothetical protein
VLIGKPVALVSTADEGVPRAGVTSVGDVANTLAPEPVSSVKAVASWAEVKEPSDVALPTEVTAPVKLALVTAEPAIKPKAVPVMFVATMAVGVPKLGVTKVGDVANTSEPVPVSSVTAARKLVDEGVPKNVATPVPRPATPVLIGKPVALIRSAWPTVPSRGLVIVGLVNKPVTVTCLVVVPWTNGISSVPVKGVVAKGSWVILTLAIVFYSKEMVAATVPLITT